MPFLRCILFLSLWLAVTVSTPARAGSGDIFLDGGGGSYTIRHIHSLRDMRYAGVVRQRYDFSCGSAAVATLLTYHYRRPVEEPDVLAAMFRQGDRDKIRKEGFS
ncbi:MAG: peptidase C39, partial [Pseudomonadota bacterium]|nr:peptidase C39 [Pseudomonadota bacterium]